MKKIRIAFIGADMSGKTTLVNFFNEKIKKEGKTSEVFFMGWRDFHNPILRLISRTRIADTGKKARSDSLSRYKSRSWIFYVIYYLELWQRYIKTIGSNKDFILFDRYFYDELLFANEIKYKIFSLITPRPDVCFILQAKIEEFKRRGFTGSEIKLKKFYKKLYRANSLCKTVRLDGSGSLEKNYNRIKIESRVLK